MRCSRASMAVATLLAVLAHSLVALVSAAKSPWQTLSGAEPLVIGRGGFSGLFPDSSDAAYSLMNLTSLPNTVAWCDVQLTKDGAGICLPSVKLENSTDIADLYDTRSNVYDVNGVSTKGWYSIDFTLKELTNISVIQGVYSRSIRFDGNVFPFLTVDSLESELKPPGIWLNIQHDTFFTQHKLNMRSFVLNVSRSVKIGFISSPEVGFLKSIQAKMNPKTTKLVYRFLGANEVDPSVKQTYGSLLKNLAFIKTFATGIIVPKQFIWPLNAKNYLEPHTSLVSDAHKLGLEVYAADFVNDFPLPYDYSHDPIAEYLNFIDNGEFSVDGVITDFPISPSAAIACFAHSAKNDKEQVKALVISKFGSSGDYTGCTDLAYKKAIEDGVDILDCPVQISRDGTLFCLSSIDLVESTNAAQSTFSDLMTRVPEIKAGNGIYAFNLTWAQIQKLTPNILSPYSKYTIYRNPKSLNAGKFLTLADFLELTKSSPSLKGVLIGVEYAAYLAEKHGLGVTDAVLSALTKAGLDKQTTLRVMIQSTNSSVLEKVRDRSKYERVYKIEEDIRGIDSVAVNDIKSFANAVVISKESVYPDTGLFLKGSTDVVKTIQSQKLPVYVETFSNEFVSQAWDFFSDATVELNSFVLGEGIDGVITGFPKTANRYRRNRCLRFGDDTPPYMSPVAPGSLISYITDPYMPPAEAPNPILTDADVDEKPLPPVSRRRTTLTH